MPGQRDQNALAPHDIADRCRLLGAEVVVNTSGKRYQVRPSNPGAGPVMFGTDAFRSNADRSDTIAHLRRAGLDVLSDPRLNGLLRRPSATPTPAAMPATGAPSPKSNSSGEGRPAKQASGQPPPVEAGGPRGSGRTADQSDDTQALLDAVSELDERVSALSGRIDELTSRTTGNTSRGTQTDARLRDLTRRVEALERRGPQDPHVPVESLNDRFRREALEFLLTLPPSIYVPRIVISESLEITGDTEIKALSQALRTLDDNGKIESVGQRANVRWRAIRQDGADDEKAKADDQQ